VDDCRRRAARRSAVRPPQRPALKRGRDRIESFPMSANHAFADDGPRRSPEAETAPEAAVQPRWGGGYEPERYDRLTGLANRAFFIEQAALALHDDPSALAVLVIGIDRFKEINDSLGYRTGDRVLCEVASRVGSQLSDDTLVARLGGDEYAIMSKYASGASAALDAAHRVRSSLESPVMLDGVALNVEVSIGIAIVGEHGTDIYDLLRHADVALARAKAHRGGVEIYAPEHDTFDPARLRLLGEIRPALERDEFILHYQPKIDLQTRRITGVEALVRWEHPELGVVPPLDFIPLVERTALIDALTLHIIDKALRQLASWTRLGLQLQMAVNLSASNLLEPELPEQIRSLIRHHDVPSERLMIEVTESAAMTDPERASQVLTGLRAQGIGVSIDDFGTGNASLAYLARIPATELKIDRSFISRACEDPRADAIVRASSDLARHFGFVVVAEGIETDATMEHLIRMGCALGQGYRISRPLPPEEITARLKLILGGGAPAPAASMRKPALELVREARS
jgi:diguanylate cyclase (GGDEF)-like protein